MFMTDPLTGGRLHAAEVNVEAELQDFCVSLASFDNGPSTRESNIDRSGSLARRRLGRKFATRARQTNVHDGPINGWETACRAGVNAEVNAEAELPGLSRVVGEF